MRIAVTGATGFLGRHVIPALAACGLGSPAFHLTVMLRPGGRRTPWVQNLASTEIDFAAPPADAWERLGCPDTLVHLAWGGLPNYRSLHHVEQELPAHYRFLKLLVESGVRRLVVTGTCFEYGMQSGPLTETLPAAPTNPYGFAKDTLRRQLEYLKAVHPFAFVWARLFYMFGDGQGGGSLLPQLERAIASGARVFDMSGGEQLRDYLPVEEVAAVLARLSLGAGDPGPVNVCSGRPVSVRALVEGWIAERGSAISLNRGAYPYPEHEPMAFWGERTKLNAALEDDGAKTADSRNA